MKTIFFYLFCGFAFLLFSCSSSKELAKKEPDLEILSLGLIQEFKISKKTLENAQFYIEDSIVFLKKNGKPSSSLVLDDGTINLDEGTAVEEKIIIPANTPVIVAKGGITWDSYQNIPKIIKVNVSSDTTKYLVFMPDEESGEFVFSLKEKTPDSLYVNYGGENLFLDQNKGKGSRLLFSSFVLGKTEMKENKFESGILIGQRPQSNIK